MEPMPLPQASPNESKWESRLMSEAIGEDQPCWLVLTKRVRKSMSNRISLEIKISCARLDQNCLADLDSGDGGG